MISKDAVTPGQRTCQGWSERDGCSQLPGPCDTPHGQCCNLLVLPVELAAPKLVGNGDQGASGFWIDHKVNNHHKIPWQEHPKGQAERKAMALSSGYEIRRGQQWIHMVDHPCRTKQAAGEERERPARPCLQQQYSALGGGRTRGGAKLFSGLFLVSSLFPSLIPPPRCSLSLGQWQEEVLGPEMASLSWCERGLGVEGGGAGGWRLGCRHLAVESCVHVTYAHKEEDQTIA